MSLPAHMDSLPDYISQHAPPFPIMPRRRAYVSHEAARRPSPQHYASRHAWRRRLRRGPALRWARGTPGAVVAGAGPGGYIGSSRGRGPHSAAAAAPCLRNPRLRALPPGTAARAAR